MYRTWSPFRNTHIIIEAQGIRRNNHLRDSYRLTGINPHFTAPGCRCHFKINSCWPIVFPWVSMDAWHWGLRNLKTDLRNRELFCRWRHNFAYRGRRFSLFVYFISYFHFSTRGICGAVNCLVSDVMINYPRVTHTVRIMALFILQRREENQNYVN